MEKSLEQQVANCLKIVTFGPESTGKTSLARALATHYNTQWVPEFAREYLQKKYDDAGEICAPEDLLPIVKGQLTSENKLAKKANKVLFCDTNPLETYVYGEAYYRNFENRRLKEIMDKSKYDLYLLTYIDVPWEADDLRDKPEEREEMFERFELALKTRNLPYIVVKGNLENRMAESIKVINALLNN